MRVFVTGASGWIGTAVSAELLAAGHEVVGLARNDESLAKLEAAGVTPHRGSLDDLASLRSGAEGADAVIHLAFKHDFSRFDESGRTERAAVELFGDVLEGTGAPFLFASGLAGLRVGQVATEADETLDVGAESPRGGGEALALSFAERGIRPVALRFAPTVHGTGGDHGFIATLAGIAKEKGVAGYVGDGSNCWSAVHRLDAAALAVLALESPETLTRVHAAGEDGITTREIAEALGAAIGVPAGSIDAADAPAHFGWIGMFWPLDMPASSAVTREQLGWTPAHPTLLEDIAAGGYLG